MNFKISHRLISSLLTFLQIEVEVKRVGAIPVKKCKGDSIQWINCDEEAAQKLLQQENHLAIERIVIDLGK